MDFAAAWDTLDVGATAAVSNGAPRPSANPTSLPMRIWQSHNFTGELVEKIDGDPRAMRFQLAPNEAGNIIGFTVRESDGHSFEPA
jgi:hypothetical protein